MGKTLDKIARYLATWRELIFRPFTFIGRGPETSTSYAQPGEFLTWTVTLLGGIGYLFAYFYADPLVPPAKAVVLSAVVLYGQLGLFAALWLFFGVLFGRAASRGHPSVLSGIKRLVSALVYLLAGTYSFYMLIWYVCVFLLLGTVFESHMPYFSERPNLAFVVTVLLLGIAVLPYCLVSWLITRAVRTFYRVGFWLGILLPTLCWFAVTLVLGYSLHFTTAEKMSQSEQSAIRTVEVLSDMQAVYHQKNGEWAKSLADLQNLQLTFGDPDGHDPIVHAEQQEVRSYRDPMDGYHISFVIFRNGKSCVIENMPKDDSSETRLSFAADCKLRPFVPSTIYAENADGGRATGFGRIVFHAWGSFF